MIGGVLVIAGFNKKIGILSTVSFYDIASDTWEGNKPKLNTARLSASACTLKETVYVFFGWDGKYRHMDSIEMISETSLVQNSTATWQLI